MKTKTWITSAFLRIGKRNTNQNQRISSEQHNQIRVQWHSLKSRTSNMTYNNVTDSWDFLRSVKILWRKCWTVCDSTTARRRAASRCWPRLRRNRCEREPECAPRHTWHAARSNLPETSLPRRATNSSSSHPVPTQNKPRYDQLRNMHARILTSSPWVGLGPQATRESSAATTTQRPLNVSKQN